MKKLFVLFVMVALSANLSASFVPGWERPILQDANMEIRNATLHFEYLEQVGILLTQQDMSDHPTRMVVDLSYGFDGIENKSYDLLVTRVEDIGCGSKRYVAELLLADASLNQHRFTVVLKDHRTRLCEDYRPYMWEATVREGYGWCGSGDATMEIYGNPQLIYTIME